MKNRTKSIEKIKREIEELINNIEAARKSNSHSHAHRLSLIKEIKERKLQNWINAS